MARRGPSTRPAPLKGKSQAVMPAAAKHTPYSQARKYVVLSSDSQDEEESEEDDEEDAGMHASR